MYARLVEVHGGTIIDLQKDELLVGRREDCDVVMKVASVSAHHCQLRRSTDGTWHVKDLRSKNGTWVNGLRIQETEVAIGDELWFSKQCRFRLEMPHRGSIT